VIVSSGLKLAEGRYEFGSLIAVGGMGEVWRGQDTWTSRTVAIKVLRPEFTGDEGSLHRLRTEAHNASMLNHPNIARVYDYREEEGTGYLVLEFVPGQSLADVLAMQTTVTASQLIDILHQCAEGLFAAHRAGVVHRDVKPGNILLGPSGRVKLTDFGISVCLGQAALTATGKVMGTAQYLAPEQALGKPATPAGDMYALGIIAYECLVGSRPFNTGGDVDIALAQVRQPPPPLPTWVDPPLRDLVLRLLSKDPAKRPSTCGELAHLLLQLKPTIGADSPETSPVPLTILIPESEQDALTLGSAPGAGPEPSSTETVAVAPPTDAAPSRPAATPAPTPGTALPTGPPAHGSPPAAGGPPTPAGAAVDDAVPAAEVAAPAAPAADQAPAVPPDGPAGPPEAGIADESNPSSAPTMALATGPDKPPRQAAPTHTPPASPTAASRGPAVAQASSASPNPPTPSATQAPLAAPTGPAPTPKELDEVPASEDARSTPAAPTTPGTPILWVPPDPQAPLPPEIATATFNGSPTPTATPRLTAPVLRPPSSTKPGRRRRLPTRARTAIPFVILLLCLAAIIAGIVLSGADTALFGASLPEGPGIDHATMTPHPPDSGGREAIQGGNLQGGYLAAHSGMIDA
jgi:serine/threonine-protein kinase